MSVWKAALVRRQGRFANAERVDAAEGLALRLGSAVRDALAAGAYTADSVSRRAPPALEPPGATARIATARTRRVCARRRRA